MNTDKGNIIVENEELSEIRELVINKYVSQLEESDENSEDKLKFNSTPNNYTTLEEYIIGHLESIGEEHPKLGKLFLRKVLFETKNSTQPTSLRRGRYNLLYKYVFSKNRDDVLVEKENYKRKVVFSRSPEHTSSEVITFLNLSDYDYKLDAKSVTTLQSLIEYIKDLSDKAEKRKYLLYLTKDFLLDPESTEVLFKLINEYNWFFLDEDIKLIFDKDILTGEYSILSWSGRKKIKGDWEKEKKSLIDIIKAEQNSKVKIDSTEIDKISTLNDNIISLLTSLDQYYKDWSILDEEEKRKVDNLQPFLKKIQNKGEEDLTSIIDDSENKTNHDFLCMIGYPEYFKFREKGEMLKYFKDFNEKLATNGNRIFRAFAVPAKYNRNKFNSSLTATQNDIVKSYLEINSKNAKTYIVFYDSESIQEGINGNLFFEQDYVISFQNNICEDLDYFKNENLSLRKFRKVDKIDLYLAFPENQDLINQTLQLKNQNIFTTKKWFRDFILKLNPAKYTNNLTYTCLEYTGKGTDDDAKINDFLKLTT